MSYRILLAIGLPIILALGSVTPSLAQSPPGEYGPGGPGGGRWNSGGGGGHRISSETIEGPPAPAVMRDSIGLSGDQLQRYTTLYTNHVNATKPARDSLRANLQEVRAAFQSGDRSAARERRSAIEGQANDLSKQDKTFDKELKNLLTKDQQKRYDTWKDNRDKARRAERRSNRQSAGDSTDRPYSRP
jgi:Spy/CpxP family protein refolding chaperone